MLAGVDSFPYNVMLLLHIVAVLVAFAPAFVWPVMRVMARKDGGGSMPPEVARQIAPTGLLVHAPALVAAGIFGILTVLLSGDTYQFSQTWVSIAFVLWFLMLGVTFLGILPADRKAAEPSDTPGADARASMFNGMLHLLIILMLIVMIWKPS